MNFKGFIFIFIIIILINCSFIEDYSNVSGLNIYCMLSNVRDTQIIIIDSIIDISQSGDTNAFVPDLDVFINNKKLNYIINDSIKYYYYTDSIMYNKQYNMKLIYNNDTFNFSTTVPESIYIHFPLQNSTIYLDSFSFISWNNASDYYVIQIEKCADTSKLFTIIYRDTIFSLYTLNEILENNEYYKFKIMAIDSNFYEHAMRQDSLAENIVGVFASYSFSKIDSVLIIK